MIDINPISRRTYLGKDILKTYAHLYPISDGYLIVMEWRDTGNGYKYEVKSSYYAWDDWEEAHENDQEIIPFPFRLSKKILVDIFKKEEFRDYLDDSDIKESETINRKIIEKLNAQSLPSYIQELIRNSETKYKCKIFKIVDYFMFNIENEKP